MTNATSATLKHIGPLDSIRGIAVILVILSHWTDFPLWTHLPLGSIGVDVFFVLSGFLITQILLVNRSGDNSENGLGVLKNFVIRRTLRIFPIYYIVITVWFLIRQRTGIATDDKLWYYFYLSNFHIAFDHAGGRLIPTWSLAVEEQFYLFWPWLMIFLPSRKLLTTIIIFILVGVISTPILAWIFPQVTDITFLTPTCFSAFGLGALLAWIIQVRPDLQPEFRRWLNIASIVALAVFLAYIVFQFEFALRLPTAILAANLIQYCLQPRESWAYRHVFSSKALMQIGKISYCIYLVHNLVPPILESGLNKLTAANLNIPFLNVIPSPVPAWLITFVQEAVITYVISWLSWRLIEGPLNNLKKYFLYSKV